VNRIFRRLRRQKHRDSGNKRQWRPEPRRRSALVAEPLENRVLLTTLTLPHDALELRFVYADPEENDPGDEVTILDEIRIGTLSGLPPEKDIVVEILDYRGADIPGTLFLDGVETDVGGGPGGLSIIDEVPSDVLGGLGQAIDALATDNLGNTYGIFNAGPLAGTGRDQYDHRPDRKLHWYG